MPSAPVATATPHTVGPTWGPPPAPARSAWKVALIVVGCAFGGLFVVGLLAAIAIPVFLNQRAKAELADLTSVTCESIGAEAVARSQAEVTGTDVPLTSMSGLTVVEDRRATVLRPAPGGQALVLTCSGTALWADGVTTPVVVELDVDSAMHHAVSVTWDE